MIRHNKIGLPATPAGWWVGVFPNLEKARTREEGGSRGREGLASRVAVVEQKNMISFYNYLKTLNRNLRLPP